jgi:hypothetical protein
MPQAARRELAHRAPAHGIDISGLDSGRRREVSGPGLRTFLNIAREWKLSENDKICVLGAPARSTFHSWIAKARAGEAMTLPLDTLLRISAILGIYQALTIIFVRDGDAATWLRSPNQGLVFGGQAPLALILAGSQDGIMLVRRHLDAWRGGVFNVPAQGYDDTAPVITNADIVFI